jgi:hypothetical protein
MFSLAEFGLAGDFDLAGAAIESVVDRLHQDDNAYRWGAIKPMDDVEGWGLNLARWKLEVDQMVDEFNERIAPRAIKLTKLEIRNAGSLALRSLQLYMSQKAQHDTV